MDASMLFGFLSICLAFIAALFLVVGRSGVPTVQDAVLAAGVADAPQSGWVAWRLRNGCGPTMVVADALLKWGRIEGLARESVWLLAERRYTATERTLLSVVVAVIGVVALLVGLATQSVVSALAVVAGVLAVIVSAVNAARDRRCEAVREAVPDALRSMSTCFDAGFTLLQTFQQISSEVQGPLQTAFSKAAHMLETGCSASESLDELRGGAAVSELAFVAVALDVQHQSGGSLKQVLDAARDMVEGELALKRSLKVQTAQAKLSARVVSSMPFVLIAVFSLVSEGFLAPFFESPAGYALLALALGMQVAGIGLVRRVLAVGVES